MAQTIQLKRGGVGALSSAVTANIGEVLIVTGSSGDLQGPFLVVGIGDTSASLVNPVQLGTTVPTLDNDNKQLNGTLFYDTDNNKLYRLDNSGNTEITLGTLENEARFALTGSTNFFKDSQIITGSTLVGSPDTAPTETRAASATNNNYALVVSQSAYFSNHNVGHPNSLAWGSNLGGSIFNDYTANTDVAEILRTFAGLISASNSALVASPTPLATKYSGYNSKGETVPTDSSDFDNIFLPVGFTEANAAYLNLKGFNGGAGTSMFSEVNSSNRCTGNTNGNYGVLIDLLGGGVADAEFDAGSNSHNFTLFAKVTQSYSDNQSNTNPSPTSNTFNTQSSFAFTLVPGASGVTVQGGPGNTIDLETIATGNPTVIPPQFKKANGANVPLQTSLRYKASGEDFTDISSSGYYKYQGIVAGVATGSTQTETEVIFGSLQSPGSQTNVNTSIFRSPLAVGDITDTSVSNTLKFTSSSFTSRSLSGAPYLNGATYNMEVTSSNLFKPLYRANATLLDGSITSTSLTFANDQTQTVTTQADGDVAQANRVYNGNTARAVNDNPGVDDTGRIAEEYSFGASNSEATNIQEGSSYSDSTFTYRVTSRNFANTTSDQDTNINYHTAGTFGTDVNSGSMAYFISNDGDDTATDSTENFEGESRRRLIEATTDLASSNVWNSGSRLTLGDGGDLQVKPGYLVNPESNTGNGRGYWYPTSGFNSAHYKWYLREFDTGETGTATNLRLTFNSTSDFVPLSSTTANKIGLGVLLEYQLNNLGGGNPKIYDPVEGYDGANGDVSNGQSTSNKLNPFSDTVDVKSGWGNATDSGTVITLNLAAGAGQVINSSNSKIYLLIRYTGSPSNTLESIQVSTT
jgi:hypothetical protein